MMRPVTRLLSRWYLFAALALLCVVTLSSRSAEAARPAAPPAAPAAAPAARSNPAQSNPVEKTNGLVTVRAGEAPFDCSQIEARGIDKQMNMHATEIMMACG